MVKVAILGSTGMLGSTLTRVLEKDFGEVLEVNRTGKSVTGNSKVLILDVLKEYNLYENFMGHEIDYIINATGMIKQVIDEKKKQDIDSARAINFDFPQRLNEYATQTGVRIIQIGTDCVYSGARGFYSEKDKFDPVDVYGKTKLLGEQASAESMIIRSSIIGKEISGAVSLLGWLLSQPTGASINGFKNHIWNGVTTLHFSQIVSGIIKSNSFLKGVQHLAPSDVVSKYELIKILATEFGRSDLEIREHVAENPINRTLTSRNTQRNLLMWETGGYSKIPTVKEMVIEYANWTNAILK